MALSWLNPEPDFTLCLAQDSQMGSVWYLPRPIKEIERPESPDSYGVFHRFLREYGSTHERSWIVVDTYEDGAPVKTAIEEVAPHCSTFLPVHEYDGDCLAYEITFLRADFPTLGYYAEPFRFAGLITENLPKWQLDPTEGSLAYFKIKLSSGKINVEDQFDDEDVLRKLAEADIQGGIDALPEYNKVRWKVLKEMLDK